MSKHSRRNGDRVKAGDRTLTDAPQPQNAPARGSAGVPPIPDLRKRSVRTWLPVAVLCLLAAGVTLLLVCDSTSPLIPKPRPKAAAPPPNKPPPWQPVSNDDRIVNLFVFSRADGLRETGMLEDPAVFDDQPVTEQEAERKQTDFFVRSPDLKVIDIWHGEPDGKGKQKPTPGHYTLMTKGNVSSPPLRVRNGDSVDPPAQRHLNNPDLVIEVKDGKIKVVRSAMHVGP